ncbi:MAG: glycosyltransferase [Pseudomonadota bacterium]
MPDVTIAMATYNGAQYLGAQLASIGGQIGINWSLVISDDGSCDHTLDIAQDFAMRWPGRVTLMQGPGQGFGPNFLTMVQRLSPDTSYVAFCDQDDVWHPGKLKQAIDVLGTQPGPAICCGARRICAVDLQPLALSPRPMKPIGFGNALVQNIASGNTMVFNAAALRVVQQAGQYDLPFHDWWMYQLITGAGGHVIYDPTPYVLYRQHRQNVIGAAHSVAALQKRLHRLLWGQHGQDMQAHLRALTQSRWLLTPAAQGQLDMVHNCLSRSWPQRLQIARTARVYRQTAVGQCGLHLSATLGLLGRVVHSTR